MSSWLTLDSSITASQRNLPEPSHPPPNYEDFSTEPPPFPALDLREPGRAELSTVSQDQCVVHLKFLAALADLRDTISTQDGLFTLQDSQVTEDAKFGSSESKALARVKEKRWAVYTARAVDRFTVWWDKCVPTWGSRMTTDKLSTPTYPTVVNVDGRIQ